MGIIPGSGLAVPAAGRRGVTLQEDLTLVHLAPPGPVLTLQGLHHKLIRI